MVRLRSYIKYYYEYLIMNILNDVGKLLIKQTFLYVIFSIYLRYCHDFLVRWKKQFDWNDKVNFKIHDITAWITNNYHTNIAQCLKKKRQPGNEVWSFNRI